MAKVITTHNHLHWPTLAKLAGGNPKEMIWDSTTGELEIPDATQQNLDIVEANFVAGTPMPDVWPTSPDLSAVAAITTLYWKNDNGNIVEMDQTEKAIADTLELSVFKQGLIDIVNAEAEKRIHEGLGFEWPSTSGQRFSLSANSQSKWIGLAVAKDYITYPLRVPTKGDDAFYDIQDSTEVMNMYLTATGTVKAHLDAATTAKESIRNATTNAEAQTAFNAYMGV